MFLVDFSLILDEYQTEEVGMKQNRIFLDSYVLQQDMRIRMPKAILKNIGAVKGKTMFDVYYDINEDTIVLKKKIRSEEDK